MPESRPLRWELVFLALGWVMVSVAHYMGLFVAPPEAMMGETGRILYAHVPTAWNALLTYFFAFIAAIGALWTGRTAWDAATTALVEVGLVLNALLLAQGSIWAKPTWGVYWTWDPRLTTTAVMVVSFGAVLLLRTAVSSPGRRLTVTAISTIVAFVNVPIVYMSVKWWKTLHQDFSSPETVSNTMVLPLRLAAFGILFLVIGFAASRARKLRARIAREADAPELPDVPAALNLPQEAD